MNPQDLLVALGAPAAFLLAILLTAVLTLLIARRAAVGAYVAARLTERSSQGAMIFAVNTLYGLLTGAMDWRPAALILMQCAFHVLLPDTYSAGLPPVGTVPQPAGGSLGGLAGGAGKAAAALLLMLMVGASMAACTTLPPSAQEAAVKTGITGCDGYATALRDLAAFRAAGLLSPVQVAKVDELRPRLNAICEGPYPTDPAAAQVELDNGMLALNSLIAQVKK